MRLAVDLHDDVIDESGRLVRLTYPASVGPDRFKIRYHYEAANLSGLPDYVENLTGNVPGVKFWQASAADAFGQYTNVTLGTTGAPATATNVVSDFDSITGAVKSISAGPGGGTSLLDLGYTWDKGGNLKSRSDGIQITQSGAALSETFEYDSLNRLKNMLTNGGAALVVEYDTPPGFPDIGNITRKDDVSSANWTYDPTKVHAVKSAGAYSFDYDANGNMEEVKTSGAVSRDITWTSYNKPRRITAGAYGSGADYSEFEYGPDRRRYRQVASVNGVETTTTYVGGLFEIRERNNGSFLEYSHRIQMAGQTVAIYRNFGGSDSDGDGVADANDNCQQDANPDQRDSNGDGYGNLCDADLNNDGIVNTVDLGLFKTVFFCTGSGQACIDADFNGDGTVNAIDLGILKLNYYVAPGPAGDVTGVIYVHRDHLGSVVALTDEDGDVLERRAYDSWGRRRAPEGASIVAGTMNFTPLGYTGHEHLPHLGLIHMNGRVYDPKIGRFLSADPYVPDPMDGQSLNRFSYVRNRPLSAIDPSGFQDCDDLNYCPPPTGCCDAPNGGVRLRPDYYPWWNYWVSGPYDPRAMELFEVTPTPDASIESIRTNEANSTGEAGAGLAPDVSPFEAPQMDDRVLFAALVPPQLSTFGPAPSAVLPALPVTPNANGQVVVTSSFGPRTVPGGSSLHNGVDLRNPLGDPVFAPQDGIIAFAGSTLRGGNSIIIDNADGSRNGFAHTAPLPGLKVGAPIKRGQQVGVSDGSGTRVPHLHFTFTPAGSSLKKNPLTTQFGGQVSGFCFKGTPGC